MAGSGLKEVWSTIYAKESTTKMLSGHQYARALRAHFLTQIALQKELLDSIEVDASLRETIVILHKEMMKTGCDVSENHELTAIAEQLTSCLHLLVSKSRTAKLWMQYSQQVSIMRRFVRAERSGDWPLHLDSIKSMIPYFHAAGHLAYAQSAHLYLQQMSKLKERMSESEYQYFTQKAGFTIRRTYRHMERYDY